MNTEQLYDLVAELLADEDSETIQAKLAQVIQALANLASNPQEPTYQLAVSDSLSALSASVDLAYTPLTLERMSEIGAKTHFDATMVAHIRQSMAANPMAPTVAYNEASSVLAERAEFVTTLRNAKSSLESMGLDGIELKEGESEIGFKIPRQIFNNDLEGFSKELHEIRLIIRAFSEIAGNAGERIELRQISTTDPLIYLAVGYLTVKYIGNSVKWCLEQWKTIEEIRNIRASTVKLKGILLAESLGHQYDEMIDQLVATRVREEAERLAKEATSDLGRENELSNHLAKALSGLLARIERGMKIDIRLSAPEEQKDGSNAEMVADFQTIAEIRDDLNFPLISDDEPILKLEKQPEKRGKK